jgi:hypothetical protein
MASFSLRWRVGLFVAVLCIGALPDRRRVESWEDVFRSWLENVENVFEFVWGIEGSAAAASLAASSGDLVMPSMKRMKRSP